VACKRSSFCEIFYINQAGFENSTSELHTRTVLNTGIVHPDEKLVPRAMRDAFPQRCFLKLDTNTVELTGTELAHQARAAAARGIS
jgi:hypothetical protein